MVIQLILLINILRIGFNFLKKEEFSNKIFLEKLIKKFKYNKKSFSILREMDNKTYKLSVKYTEPSEEKKGIVIQIFEEGIESTFITENIIKFSKLTSLVEKLSLSNALSRLIPINMIDSFDFFIEKILIYFFYIIKKDDKIVTGVLPRPTGINSNRSYQFQFLGSECSIDVLIMSKRETKFFVYSCEK